MIQRRISEATYNPLKVLPACRSVMQLPWPEHFRRTLVDAADSAPPEVTFVNTPLMATIFTSCAVDTAAVSASKGQATIQQGANHKVYCTHHNILYIVAYFSHKHDRRIRLDIRTCRWKCCNIPIQQLNTFHIIAWLQLKRRRPAYHIRANRERLVTYVVFNRWR